MMPTSIFFLALLQSPPNLEKPPTSGIQWQNSHVLNRTELLKPKLLSC